MNWFISRIKAALAGLTYALLNDRSFQWQVYGVFGVATVVACFCWPLREIEWLFLGLSYTLIIITELQNSSLEEALDRLHPEQDPMVGRSKDLAAGSVLASGMFFIFVLITIVISRVI